MKKNLKAALCLLLAGAALITGCASAKPVQTETFVMNTFLVQTLYGAGAEEAAASDAALAQDLEQKLSRTLPESEISQLVAADGRVVPLSEETVEILRAALEAEAETEGAYNPFLGELRDLWGFGDAPAVPDAAAVEEAIQRTHDALLNLMDDSAAASNAAIDLGGIAKGYALDCIRANLRAYDLSGALVDFGGALLVAGSKPDGPWLVGVRDPLSAQGRSIAEFEITENICVETSGISEQSFEEDGRTYHHLLDPETGWPADNELASVTVVSSSGTEADIYSTALFVMGLEKARTFADEHELGALFITRDRDIYCSEAFPFDLTITDDAFRLR